MMVKFFVFSLLFCLLICNPIKLNAEEKTVAISQTNPPAEFAHYQNPAWVRNVSFFGFFGEGLIDKSQKFSRSNAYLVDTDLDIYFGGNNKSPLSNLQFGLHIGGYYSKTKLKDYFTQYSDSFEIGSVFLWQMPDWQLALRCDYRRLEITGESLQIDYEIKNQYHHQLEFQFIFDYFLYGDFLNLWEIIGTFQIDIDRNNSTALFGIDIPESMDPAPNESIYGADLYVYIWDNSAHQITPYIRSGLYYYENGDYYMQVSGIGIRLLQGIYMDAGRNISCRHSQSSSWYLTVSLGITI